MNAQVVFNPAFHDQPEQVLHTRLTEFNARRLKPAMPNDLWEAELSGELALRVIEGHFLEGERAAIAALAAQAPTDADGFVAWFEQLKLDGPGQNDRLFPWLSQHAPLPAMRWFLTQEIAGEAGFDDLVALTQVRFDVQPKLEMARNYWDEMGRGHEHGMHGGMLANVAREFALEPHTDSTVWEALALGNLMVGLAANRRYAYHSVGALGVVELTAPTRVGHVNDGLKRLGATPQGRQYFQLHAGLDVRHSEAWNREVLRPLVAAQPQTARAIAEGALMRLRAGERTFARYRRELGVA
jgi:hypothetical protein